MKSENIAKVLHIVFAVSFLLCLIIPIQSLLDGWVWKEYPMQNILFVITTILIAVSFIQNVKMARRSSVSKSFLSATGTGLVLLVLPFFLSVMSGNEWDVLYIIFTLPVAVVFWIISLVMGFKILQKNRV